VIYGAHSAADLITLLSTQKRNLYSSRVPSETQYLDLEPGCALFPYPAGARSGISPNCAVEWIWEFGVYHQILALYLRNILHPRMDNENENLGYYCVGVYLLAEFYVLQKFCRILI
jgi:hypothetical protein